jgi:hypothetical protein
MTFTQVAFPPQYEAPVPTASEHSSMSKRIPEGKHSNPVSQSSLVSHPSRV